jgi:hypothetical protein
MKTRFCIVMDVSGSGKAKDLAYKIETLHGAYPEFIEAFKVK